MVIKILMTPENKKVQIDTKKDTCLYSAPQDISPWDTTTGVDLYAHKARSGKTYFYKHYWSMWAGDSDRYELVDEDEARKFLLQKAALSWPFGLNDKEWARAQEFFPGIFDEDA